jgi:hypothetical protein
MANLDISNNTYYMLKIINDYKTAPIYSMFKIYNPQHINLNNAEIMTTLNYCEKYNNFIIKSITIMNKPYKKNNNSNNNLSMNKRIIDNIRKKVEF